MNIPPIFCVLGDAPIIVPWLQSLLRTSFDASLMAIAVLALQPLLRRHIPARWRFGVWLLVLVRFVPLPLPESRFSLYNLLPHARTAVVAEAAIPARVIIDPVLPTPSPVVDHFSGTAPPPAQKPTPTAMPSAPMPAVRAAPILNSVAAKQSPAFPWPALIAAAYFIGASAVLVRLLFSTLALRRIVRLAEPLADEKIHGLLAEVCETMGVARVPPMLLTDALSSPALVGIARPRLLFPRMHLPTLNDGELRLVFLHEVAHLRRRDVLTNYAMAMVAVAHWFNPVLWLVLPVIRAERELACDELVLLHTSDPAIYGQTLLTLLQAAPQARSLAPAVGIVESRSTFSRRIQMIAGFRKRSAWTLVPTGIALALAMACAMTSPLSKAAPPPATPGRRAMPTPSMPPVAEGTTQPAYSDNAQLQILRARRDSLEQDIAVLTAKKASPAEIAAVSDQMRAIDRETGQLQHRMNLESHYLADAQVGDASDQNIAEFIRNDPEIRILEATKDALAQERAATVARHSTPMDIAAIDARSNTVNDQIAAIKKDLTQEYTYAAQKKAINVPTMVMKVYDVHDILDVSDDQKGPLTSDQRNAMKDLGETLKNALDTNAVMSTFNGMVVLNASDDVHKKVARLLNELGDVHRARMNELRVKAEQAKAHSN